ncbi:MAG: LamG domain-containing protein, partial [Dolichospermum sp.]
RNDIQKNNYIISKGSFSGNNGYSLSILNDYKLTFDIGSQRFQTTATIPASTWTHVAASYDGNTVKLYINGTLSASFASVGTIAVNTGNLIIGSSQDYKGDANYGFSGKIDEVAVFCGVNFNTPIADMMNGKLVGNEYGLIAYYNFEHGAGITNLTDLASSSGANNGILNNMNANTAWVNGPAINYCSTQISSSTLNPSINSHGNTYFHPIGGSTIVFIFVLLCGVFVCY